LPPGHSETVYATQREMTPIDRAVEALRRSKRIMVFSGAGLGTESGIPDFRGPDGLWAKVDPSEFTIDRYMASRDTRARRWRMHLEGALWGARSGAQPNSGHKAVARLGRAGRLAGVVTQNVDGLHRASGLEDGLVAELHGNARNAHCMSCDGRWPIDAVLERVEAGDDDPRCPACGGIIKTDTIMFGEMLPEEEVSKAGVFLAMCDSVLVLGSTVSVWPAADVVLRAAHQGKPIVIVNKGPTDADDIAAVRIDSGIGDVLPEIVGRVLDG